MKALILFTCLQSSTFRSPLKLTVFQNSHLYAKNLRESWTLSCSNEATTICFAQTYRILLVGDVCQGLNVSKVDLQAGSCGGHFPVLQFGTCNGWCRCCAAVYHTDVRMP